MNILSNITNHLIGIIEEDVLNHTISFEKTNEVDLNKSNIYPLTNIDIIQSIVTDNVINVQYTITIVQQRDIDPLLRNEKIYSSNLIDNLNECHAIATRAIAKLKRPNDDNVFISTLSSITMLKKVYNNDLDGVRFTIELAANNEISGC